MECPNCGKTMGPDEVECECKNVQGTVTVLSPQERESFNGVTLDDEEEQNRSGSYSYHGPNGNVYIKHVNFGSGKLSFWTKLLIALVVAAIIFVVLPVAIFAVLAFSVLWVIINILRR